MSCTSRARTPVSRSNALIPRKMTPWSFVAATPVMPGALNAWLKTIPSIVTPPVRTSTTVPFVLWPKSSTSESSARSVRGFAMTTPSSMYVPSKASTWTVPELSTSRTPSEIVRTQGSVPLRPLQSKLPSTHTSEGASGCGPTPKKTNAAPPSTAAAARNAESFATMVPPPSRSRTGPHRSALIRAERI